MAQMPYKVTSSSRLNVRTRPSTSGQVMGTFQSGQQIQVISIENGWAKVEFNGKTGFVSARYIKAVNVAPAPSYIPAPTRHETVTVREETTQDDAQSNAGERTEIFGNAIEAPLTFGFFMPESMNMYLAVEAGLGYSNFLWNGGSVKGKESFSVGLAAQLYFEDKTIFIPSNWYSELALGFNSKGASKFSMNYVHIGLYPLGYRLTFNPVDVVLKGGVVLGVPVNKLSTKINSWGADFQCGVGAGVRAEWREFSIGCSVEYDFTQVASSCNQTLNNFAVLGTISYKFAKLGHR